MKETAEDKIMEIEGLAETVQMAVSEVERCYFPSDKTPISLTVLILIRMIGELKVMVLET